MELGAGLSRSDLASVGPVTSTNTLKVLPFGKSRRQKLVVGDSFGCVTCLQTKRGETSTVFKTQTNEEGNPVTCVALHNDSSGDKIFAAAGRAVHGVNKKGKVFCTVKTNLSETIQHVKVREKRVFASGELTYASYEDSKEVEYLKSEDTIGSMALAGGGSRTLLGGRDSQVHLVQAGQVVGRFLTDSGVSALEPYQTQHAQPGDQSGGSTPFIFGTESGQVGLVAVDADANTFQPLWQSGDPAVPRSSVNCVAAYDLTKDDSAEIIVGGVDGSVQIYRVSEEPGRGLELEEKNRPGKSASLLFERSLEESIQSVQAGVLSAPGYDEVVVCTYSGNVVSFTTEALDQAEEGDQEGRSKAALDAQGKIKHMTEELASLEAQIAAARDKLGALKRPESQYREAAIGFQQLQVSHSFKLNPSEGSYTLSFELPVAVDLVVLSSDVPFTLLHGGGGAAAQNVVVSTSEPSAPGEAMRAVFRCTEPHKRVEVPLRTVEGQYGQIRASVVASVRPKVAQQTVIDVKPLSLHHRLGAPPQSASSAPLSLVQFSGTFSLNQVHDWVSACLPGVPQNAPSLGGAEAKEEGGEPPMAQLWFEHTVVRSVLSVRYRAGLAIIESDSVSAIAIIREVFSAEANKRKAALDIRFTIDPGTVPSFLKRVDKQLGEQARLARKLELVPALKEVTNDGADTAFLSKEHQAILKNAHSLAQRQERRPAALQTLHGIVTDLFVDVRKFEGKDARNAAVHADLMNVLHNYSYEALVDFFASR